MSLKYNLETIPESGVKKISQNNDPLGDVQFVLTPANESYEPLAGAQTINATTDWATGELVFSYTDEASGQDRPYTLEELGNISRYWILQEDADTVPAGYRNAGTVEMRFSHAQQNDSSKGAGLLLASNQFSLAAACSVLGVSEGGYYHWRAQRAAWADAARQDGPGGAHGDPDAGPDGAPDASDPRK